MSELRNLIREGMELKETEELIAIWRRQDKSEWTDEALDVAGELLLGRTGNLLEPSPKADAEEGREETRDTHHSFDSPTRLAYWSRLISWLFLGASLIIGVAATVDAFESPIYFDPSTGLFDRVMRYLGEFLVSLLLGFFFLVLRGMEELIYLFVAIEGNTRRAAKARK